jgi:2-amino-4-hydroxy-6-hydroxymethyldihydropteridine diphosphokinase
LEPNVFISLGSNLGDRQANLIKAAGELVLLPQTEITGESRARVTRAVGLSGQPDFLNQVKRLSTRLVPAELLESLLSIENRLGRVRTVRWGPRVIDLDILFYGYQQCNTDSLVLPHPEVWNRPFFLEMIQEIDRGFLQGWNRQDKPQGKSIGREVE